MTPINPHTQPMPGDKPLLQPHVRRLGEVQVDLVNGQWRVVDAQGRVIAASPYRATGPT